MCMLVMQLMPQQVLKEDTFFHLNSPFCIPAFKTCRKFNLHFVILRTVMKNLEIVIFIAILSSSGYDQHPTFKTV